LAVDLLNAYLNRHDLAYDLGEAVRQLADAATDDRPALSVRTKASGFRTRNMADRLTADQVREMAEAFESGTPRWQLAE
jgi:hypothetical protein